MEQKEQQEKLEGLKKLIIANSKDASFAKKQIAELISIQKQLDIEPVEIIVPLKSITDEIDFGETKIQRCSQGYLFTAKGGLYTLVSWNNERVCALFNTLFYYRDKLPEDKEMQERYDAYTNAILYVFRAPMFASLNEETLIDTATNILRIFNKSVSASIESIEPSDETEADVKANIEFEREQKAIDQLIDEAKDLPDYDADSEDEES